MLGAVADDTEVVMTQPLLRAGACGLVGDNAQHTGSRSQRRETDAAGCCCVHTGLPHSWCLCSGAVLLLSSGSQFVFLDDLLAPLQTGLRLLGPAFTFPRNGPNPVFTNFSFLPFFYVMTG